ncbi:MAG: sigma-70 family RNA polymerase sigma factor [Thermoanaerobaculia bacterium]
MTSSRNETSPTLSQEVAEQEDLSYLLQVVRPELRRVLAHYRIPYEDAEDLVQEALLRLVYKWGEVSSPQGWLVGTLRKLCGMYWRSRRRRSWLVEVDSPDLDEMAEPVAGEQAYRELCVDLDAAVATLKPKQRAFFLCWLEEPNSEQLQQLFGYQASSVRQTVKRCRGQLQSRLAPWTRR